MGKLVDLEGKVFGHLTVKSRGPNKAKSNRATWICVCVCGNLITRPSYSLINSSTKNSSCGCINYQAIDLIGKVFGYLTVLEKAKSRTYIRANGTQHKEAIWRCSCSGGGVLCKKEIEVFSGSLIRNLTTNCGCKRPFIKKSAPINNLIRKYKYNAKLYEREFSITREYFIQLINSNCYYCNTIPSQKIADLPAHYNFSYNGIDRIDNSKGYIEGNVVPCCGLCNRMKNDLSLEDFFGYVKAIYNHSIQGSAYFHA